MNWWRAKPRYLTGSHIDWLDPARTYPGRKLTRPKLKGTVRLFRDVDAFERENVSFSIDVPLAWLDEVDAPK